MKQIGIPTVAGTFLIAGLLVASGCSPKASGDALQKGPPPAPAAALNDPRIPPAQRAALEQTMAQQKSSVSKVDEKMKAHAAQHP